MPSTHNAYAQFWPHAPEPYQGASALAGALALFMKASGSRATGAREMLCYSYRAGSLEPVRMPFTFPSPGAETSAGVSFCPEP